MSNTFLTIIVGVGTIAIGALLVYATRKEERNAEFDERQIQARARGVRLGYDVLACFVAFIGLMELCEVNLGVATSKLLFLGLFTSIVVYGLYSIINDAYVGINENLSKRTNTLFLLACVNCGNFYLQRGHNSDVAYLCAFCGISLFMIASALRIHAKKQARNDEE